MRVFFTSLHVMQLIAHPPPLPFIRTYAHTQFSFVRLMHMCVDWTAMAYTRFEAKDKTGKAKGQFKYVSFLKQKREVQKNRRREVRLGVLLVVICVASS